MTSDYTAATVSDYLDRHQGREPGTKIQYGHPSPRYWSSTAASREELLRPMLDSDRPLNLYLHIPFCPPTDPEACGFCLFAREDYRSYDLVNAYMADLTDELDAFADIVGRRSLHTLYFGGGTPNILSPESIRQIFARLHQRFDIPATCEVTFEGTPGLFTLRRLEALAEVGVTRISIGAQTLKPHLLKYSGRTQRHEHIERTIQFCAQHGMRCSVDLITGWFEQSAQDVLDDITQLAEWGATSIVNHPLTLAGDSVFSRRRHELPSVEVTRQSFVQGQALLQQLGYRMDGYTDYTRSDLPPVRFLEMYRQVMDHDRIGLGYGANSLLAGTVERPGHTWKNIVGRGPYHLRVAAGQSCASSHFRFTDDDLRLIYVLKGLEGSPWLTAEGYGEKFGRDLYADFEPWWTALTERGWLTYQDGSPRLVGDGIFYTSEVQRCISEPRNAVLRRTPRFGGSGSLNE